VRVFTLGLVVVALVLLTLGFAIGTINVLFPLSAEAAEWPDVVAVTVDRADQLASFSPRFHGPCSSEDNALVLAFYRATTTDVFVAYDGAFIVEDGDRVVIYDVPTSADDRLAAICGGHLQSPFRFWAVRRK
jgi:hypothetical protein